MEGTLTVKITKTQLTKLVKEELADAMSESEQWQMGRSRKASDMYQLGRDDYGAFSAEEPTDDGVELDGERYPDDKYYAKGWRDNQEEYAQDVEDDSFRRDPAHDYDDDSHEEVVDDDWMWENKITKKGNRTMKVTKAHLAKLIKEEMSDVLNTGGEQSPEYGDKHSELYALLDSEFKKLGYNAIPMDRIVFFVDVLAGRNGS